MKRWAKFLIGCVAVVAAAPLIAFGAYDVFVFQPRMPEIRDMLQQATPDERSPPATLLKVLRTQSHANRCGWATRLVTMKLRVPDPKTPQTRRQFVELLWQTLISLHLSEAEITTLVLGHAHMGEGITGFSRAAQKVAGVPLSEVSIDEAARLVALSRSPLYMPKSPQRWSRLAGELAQRARAMP